VLPGGGGGGGEEGDGDEMDGDAAALTHKVGCVVALRVGPSWYIC